MCLLLEMVSSDLHLLTLTTNATPEDFINLSLSAHCIQVFHLTSICPTIVKSPSRPEIPKHVKTLLKMDCATAGIISGERSDLVNTEARLLL